MHFVKKGSYNKLCTKNSIRNSKRESKLVEELIKRITKFRDDRDWKQFHSPENIAKSIVIEAAELLENFQWNSEFDEGNVKEELADVMNYCLLLADCLNIDVIENMHKKIDQNEKKYPISKAKGTSKKYTEL